MEILFLKLSCCDLMLLQSDPKAYEIGLNVKVYDTIGSRVDEDSPYRYFGN